MTPLEYDLERDDYEDMDGGEEFEVPDELGELL